jgi:hypothetical protein
VLLIVEIASAPLDSSDTPIPSVEGKSGKQAVAAAAAAAAAAANSISVPEDCSLFVHSLELKAKYHFSLFFVFLVLSKYFSFRCPLFILYLLLALFLSPKAKTIFFDDFKIFRRG